jgi:hypothetical protein
MFSKDKQRTLALGNHMLLQCTGPREWTHADRSAEYEVAACHAITTPDPGRLFKGKVIKLVKGGLQIAQ